MGEYGPSWPYCKISFYHAFIAPLIDIPMLYIIYLTIHKVKIHAGAIRKLVYGLFVCTRANPVAKTRGLSSLTDVQPIQISRLAPVLKAIFHHCVISYTCSLSNSDGSVFVKQSHQS